MVYRLTGIDEELWHRFKVLCLLEKTTLRAKLLKYVQKEVDKKEGKQ